MPYKLSGNCVVKEDGSAVKGGCHETHEQAVAHLRALYANVEDAKTKDVGAVASPNNLSGPNSLLGVLGMGRDKKHKHKHKHKHKDEDTTDEKTKVKGVDEHGALSVTQDASGGYRWILRSSSGFRDRDGELITTKALEDDCERMNETGAYGPLRWWHIGSKSETPERGLDIGDCDFAMMSGHTRIESGTFKHPAFAIAVKQNQASLGGSLGFKYPATQPDADKTISYVRTFERSVLPKPNVSNLMALKQRLFGKQEDAMLDEAAQVAKLKELVGAENHALVDSFLASSKRDEGALTAMGVGVKAKMDEAKEDKKEEAGETAAEEAKEDAKKTKEAEVAAPAFDTEALATALMTKMQSAFVTPAMLDTKFSELTTVATKSADEQKVALKEHGNKLDALDTRLKALEGDTPETKRGYKASEAGGIDIMKALLGDFAASQGLDVNKLGVKANQTPVNELERITDRLAKEMMSGTAPIA